MPKLTTQQFIAKAKTIHGDTYSYPDEYVKAHNPIKIVCSIHGIFSQRPDAHIYQKQGCPRCGLENRRLPNQKTTEQFIKEAKAKWGDKYDYSGVMYKNKTTKIKFNCSIHGEIEQYPLRHIKNGCPFCNGRGISKHSKTSFIEIANKIHKNKYDYSKTNFIRMNDSIVIVCPLHGEFTQRAGNHIHLNNGCPHCAKLITTSTGEKQVVDFIRQNYNQEIIENDRTVLDGKEIDIYLPDIGLGIEYHGIYWHLETIRGKKYHFEKWRKAREKGVRLIQLYDTEWEQKQAIVQSKLRSILNKTKRIGARKAKLVELTRYDKDTFLDQNHLQGSDSSKIWMGLLCEDEIIACMTFGPSRFNKKYDYELVRFCNKLNTSVIGGASKLLAAFRSRYTGSIISYADKRHSDGGLYKSLGFRLDGETDPSFMYFHIGSCQLYNRMNFQKKSLVNMPNYSEHLTEYEIMQLNGYDRIWDAGQYRFVLSCIDKQGD